jgi:hypothetical protein
MCHCRGDYFNRVPATEGEILFFACLNRMDCGEYGCAEAFFHKAKYSIESPQMPLASGAPTFLPELFPIKTPEP